MVAFDFEQLDAITGGDAEFEREVLGDYLQSAPIDIERIEAAIIGADAHQVDRAAHALKGASSTIGATGVAAIAREIEHAGKTGDVPTAAARLQSLRDAFHETTDLLRTRLARAA